VPDAVAERFRGGVLEFLVVAVAEEAGPGGEVGGDLPRGGQGQEVADEVVAGAGPVDADEDPAPDLT